MKNKVGEIKIVVIEDDISIAKSIEYNLKKDGYRVNIIRDTYDIISEVKDLNPDVVLVDWILPGMPGITICKMLRSSPETCNIPIIMISSKKDEIDKVVGLEHGADDYITKPISPIELSARIKAIMRRIRPAFVERKLNYNDIDLNLDSFEVRRKGNIIKLSRIEFQILEILMEYPTKVFSRDILIERVWGDHAEVDERTIDVHITRLRKALSNFGHDVIKTVRMVGYRLE